MTLNTWIWVGVVQLVEQTPHLEGYMPEGACYLFPSLPEGVNGNNAALRLLRETRFCTIARDTFGES